MADSGPTFSFSDWNRNHPSDQPPGDRIDAEFSRQDQALRELSSRLDQLRRSDGALQNDIVTRESLSPDLLEDVESKFLNQINPLGVLIASNTAEVRALHAHVATMARETEQAAIATREDANLVRNWTQPLLQTLDQQKSQAIAQLNQVVSRATDVVNDANDAQYWGNYSYSWGQVSYNWAEYMGGPIPPDILATMGISGNHWSSRWWANQATASAGDAENWYLLAQQAAADAAASLDSMTDLYLGPKASSPSLDNDGNPLQVGAIYYNTSDHNMYVWTGSFWQVSNNSQGWVPEAPVDGKAYHRRSAAWEEDAGGGIVEAPNDGVAYARKSLGWAQLNAADVIVGAGPGNVAGALALKADQTSLVAEASTRSTNDNNINARIDALKTSNITNDSSVSGTTSKDALDSLANAIASNTSSIALKAPINNPVFTGDPRAPTPAPGDNDTSIPTTAWVQSTVATAVAAKPSLTVSDAPPAGALDSSMWWESDTGYLYLRYNDGNSSQWVQMNGIPANITAGYVAKSGDTMTGALVVAPSSGSSSLYLNKPANASFIQGQMAGKARWNVTLGNGTPETGSNVGSDFVIGRYDDSGTLIDAPFTINRASGAATLMAAAFGATVTIAPTSSAANLILNKPQTTLGASLLGYSVNVPRWQVTLGNGGAETGGNVGNDFQIARFNDAGTVIDVPFSITRSNGNAVFGATARILGGVGYYCRNGINGGYGANVFNLFYSAGVMQMWADATNMGNISIASDYRIKKDVTPLPSTWEKVRALRPISYTHQDYTPPLAVPKEDGSPADPMVQNDDIERWGFIAHELQETLIPDAATGVKDSPEHIQSPNPWTVIATLTKALQEAMARIEALENLSMGGARAL